MRLLGDCLLEVDAVVVRQVGTGDRPANVAVVFQHENPHIEGVIREAVTKALAEDAGPSVLVVHHSSTALVALAEGVLRTGRRPLLAFTPLEAIHWLCQEGSRIEAVLVDAAFDDGRDGAFPSFVRRDFPHVRRVRVYDTLLAAELGRLFASQDMEAALAAPWTPSSVDVALEGQEGPSGAAGASVPPRGA